MVHNFFVRYCTMYTYELLDLNITMSNKYSTLFCKCMYSSGISVIICNKCHCSIIHILVILMAPNTYSKDR